MKVSQLTPGQKIILEGKPVTFCGIRTVKMNIGKAGRIVFEDARGLQTTFPLTHGPKPIEELNIKIIGDAQN